MTNGYDKPLHSPSLLKPMESRPRELDEAAVDAAIADILSQEAPASQTASGTSLLRPEFPVLQSQESIATKTEHGLSSVLRQKWAQLSGAA